MASIDPVSDKSKKKLNYLKAALTDQSEFDGEPTWDETINWIMESEKPASKVIRQELENIGDNL